MRNTWTNGRNLTILLGATLIFGGCATSEVRKKNYGDVSVIEHVDTNDNPCDDKGRFTNSGCYLKINGEHHVWYSDVANPSVIKHELAHARGMRHGLWDARGCTVVTHAGGGYRMGQHLCVDKHGENIAETETENPWASFAWRDDKPKAGGKLLAAVTPDTKNSPIDLNENITSPALIAPTVTIEAKSAGQVLIMDTTQDLATATLSAPPRTSEAQTTLTSSASTVPRPDAHVALASMATETKTIPVAAMDTKQILGTAALSAPPVTREAQTIAASLAIEVPKPEANIILASTTSSADVNSAALTTVEVEAATKRDATPARSNTRASRRTAAERQISPLRDLPRRVPASKPCSSCTGNGEPNRILWADEARQISVNDWLSKSSK